MPQRYVNVASPCDELSVPDDRVGDAASQPKCSVPKPTSDAPLFLEIASLGVAATSFILMSFRCSDMEDSSQWQLFVRVLFTCHASTMIVTVRLWASCVKLFRVITVSTIIEPTTARRFGLVLETNRPTRKTFADHWDDGRDGFSRARTHGQDHKGGLQSSGQKLMVPTGTFATLALAGTLHVVEATKTSFAVAATSFFTCCCGNKFVLMSLRQQQCQARLFRRRTRRHSFS